MGRWNGDREEDRQANGLQTLNSCSPSLNENWKVVTCKIGFALIMIAV
jgi:hypothetical protein